MVDRRSVLKGAAAAGVVATAGIIKSTPSMAQKMDAAKKWIDSEFTQSTLSKDQQMAELEWFVNAAKPFAGMKINCASETIKVHEYESQVLAKAFAEITGIEVKHDLTDEGTVVDKIGVEIQSGRPVYDF